MPTVSACKASHVAVIAFPFSSHPLSTLRLVLRLARSSPDTHFTFLCTPSVNASLFKSSPPLANLTPFDTDNGVPAAQTESELSFPEKVGFFYSLMQRPGSVERELAAAEAAAGVKFTCLLVDAVLSLFVADVAEERCVPWIALWSPTPMLLSAYVHTDNIRERCAAAASADGEDAVAKLELDFVPGLKGMRFSELMWGKIFHGFDERFKFLHAISRLGHLLPRASAVVLNSFRELNPEELNRDMDSKFQALLNVGFFTVSFPVVQPSVGDPTGCLAWLDGQKPNSIAYICFGTLAEFSEDDLKVVAEALEETDTAFLWSLSSDHQRLLPGGFAERTQGHGRIVTWTDQPRVLAHGSLGAIVTNCGCNTVNECIAHGVPVICGKAFSADNTMHAQLVERDWGMGVRATEAGVLTKNGLVKALEMVLRQDEGKKMRERVLATKKLAIDASSPGGSGATDFDALMGLLSASG